MLSTHPAHGVRTSCRAFITSIAATTWPERTVSPTFTVRSTSSAFPAKGEYTGVAAS